MTVPVWALGIGALFCVGVGWIITSPGGSQGPVELRDEMGSLDERLAQLNGQLDATERTLQTKIEEQVSSVLTCLESRIDLVEKKMQAALGESELQDVTGIGKKRALALVEAGYLSVEDLAGADAGSVSDVLGSTTREARRWIENAQDEL